MIIVCDEGRGQDTIFDRDVQHPEKIKLKTSFPLWTGVLPFSYIR